MTSYNSKIHRRQSIRLRGYDYSQAGAYFITICTYQKECIFGEVMDCQMRLNKVGCIVAEECLRSPTIRPGIELDEWVIMPNHIHAIVIFTSSVRILDSGAHNNCAPLRRKPRSLSSLIAGFKSTTTKQINEIRQTPKISVWQRNYYERVIRNEASLNKIQQYIINNPFNWLHDLDNPTNSALK
ncbi:transposase [Chroococcidiopsis sp. FACHB-1243]|uniref:transposase n=1 Tax=Chroococcidiopsis sp. [FACHB-1243] TaxID=2692781 RepID=UPI001783F2E9|nr:transposase [Chroococcidiopsis sp. [FACHB-1243]]MBD2306175.1 transposase [Chroococcidiopsis sp. [FACHB-1243]]